MAEQRLGDDIDDFCIKCKRISNHLIVSLMDGAAAKVRCRSCYSEHDFRHEQVPPSKKELKKQALLAAEALAGEKTADPQS
jgi:DNA-directed RNA polymerase subunit M/transcription elongation factor TFIIS